VLQSEPSVGASARGDSLLMTDPDTGVSARGDALLLAEPGASADEHACEQADAFPQELKMYLFVRSAPDAARGSTRIGGVSDVYRRLRLYNAHASARDQPWRIALVLVVPRTRRLRLRKLVRAWKATARIPWRRFEEGVALARALRLPAFVWPETLATEAELPEKLSSYIGAARDRCALPESARAASARARIAAAYADTSSQLAGVSYAHRPHGVDSRALVASVVSEFT